MISAEKTPVNPAGNPATHPLLLRRLSTISRVLVDLLVVSLAMIVTLAVRFWIDVQFRGIESSEALSAFRAAVLFSVLLVGSISVNVFSFKGFYAQNRRYEARYKVGAIVQAVAIAFAIFGAVVLLLWDIVEFPRAVLFPAFVLTLVGLIAMRLWVHRIPKVEALLDRVDALAEPPDRVERVLVVGGAGYIGSALLGKLLDRGYRVRLLDLLLFGEGPIADVIDHPNLEIIREDFRQVDQVVRAISGMDAVIHLGAIVGDPACEIDHQLTLDTNFLATRMLAEVAQAAGAKRFVFASTCSIYGASDDLLDEQSEPNPVSLYAQSKIACEEVLAEIPGDFSPVILRFGTIYGLSGRTRFDLVVNLLTAKALVDGEITIFGGDQWRPFLHVDDAASAVLRALEAPRAVVHRQVFNVGSNAQNYTIDQIGEIIQAKLPAATIEQLGGDGGDRRDYRVDFTRIHSQLGFRPAWTVEEGVQQVIDAMASGEIDDYGDPMYSNVKSLETGGIAEPGPLNGRVVLSYGMHFPEDAGVWTTDLVGNGSASERQLATTGVGNGELDLGSLEGSDNTDPEPSNIFWLKGSEAHVSE